MATFSSITLSRWFTKNISDRWSRKKSSTSSRGSCILSPHQFVHRCGFGDPVEGAAAVPSTTTTIKTSASVTKAALRSTLPWASPRPKLGKPVPSAVILEHRPDRPFLTGDSG